MTDDIYGGDSRPESRGAYTRNPNNDGTEMSEEEHDLDAEIGDLISSKEGASPEEIASINAAIDDRIASKKSARSSRVAVDRLNEARAAQRTSSDVTAGSGSQGRSSESSDITGGGDAPAESFKAPTLSGSDTEVESFRGGSPSSSTMAAGATSGPQESQRIDGGSVAGVASPAAQVDPNAHNMAQNADMGKGSIDNTAIPGNGDAELRNQKEQTAGIKELVEQGKEDLKQTKEHGAMLGKLSVGMLAAAGAMASGAHSAMETIRRADETGIGDTDVQRNLEYNLLSDFNLREGTEQSVISASGQLAQNLSNPLTLSSTISRIASNNAANGFDYDIDKLRSLKPEEIPGYLVSEANRQGLTGIDRNKYFKAFGKDFNYLAVAPEDYNGDLLRSQTAGIDEEVNRKVETGLEEAAQLGQNLKERAVANVGRQGLDITQGATELWNQLTNGEPTPPEAGDGLDGAEATGAAIAVGGAGAAVYGANKLLGGGGGLNSLLPGGAAVDAAKKAGAISKAGSNIDDIVKGFNGNTDEMVKYAKELYKTDPKQAAEIIKKLKPSQLKSLAKINAVGVSSWVAQTAMDALRDNAGIKEDDGVWDTVLDFGKAVTDTAETAGWGSLLGTGLGAGLGFLSPVPGGTVAGAAAGAKLGAGAGALYGIVEEVYQSIFDKDQWANPDAAIPSTELDEIKTSRSSAGDKVEVVNNFAVTLEPLPDGSVRTTIDDGSDSFLDTQNGYTSPGY